jgi:cation-transporting P-type ATPase C
METASAFERWLHGRPGITRAEARPTTGSVILHYDHTQIETTTLIELMRSGLRELAIHLPQAVSKEQVPSQHLPAQENPPSSRFSLILGLGWFLAITGFLAYLGFRRIIQRRPIAQSAGSLAGVVALFGTLPLLYRALRELRERRGLTLFPFLAGACLLAVVFGEALTALEIIWVTRLATWIEDYVADRSRRAIRETLRPRLRNAVVMRDGQELEIPVDAIQRDDLVVVRSGERIAVDGIVVQGEALVDEAHITGQAEPALRINDSWVYAGTIVQDGKITIHARDVGEATYLNRIVRMVEESLQNRAAAETRADQLARRLVVLGGIATLLTFLVTRQISRALSVMLVMACPCATVLAASTALTAALANAARNRMIVKGGMYLERFGNADCFCFDKTGTLTLETPCVSTVTDVEDPQGSAMRVFELAATAEARSTHPLGKAIVAAALSQGITPRRETSSRVTLGKGIWAQVNDEEILVGNREFMQEKGCDVSLLQKASDELAERGETAVFVARNGKIRGLIGVGHTVRPGSKEVLAQLRQDGVRGLFLITGDQGSVAGPLAAQLGFDQCGDSLLPEDKADFVNRLRNRCQTVVVIGDGVNDAPALSRAHVGVAMGAGGAEAAVQAADIALMDSDIRGLIALRQLSRRTMRVIEQNHWLAVGTNVAGILLGALGWITPIMAGMVHILHTGGIMLNSSRLLRRKVDSCCPLPSEARPYVGSKISK